MVELQMHFAVHPIQNLKLDLTSQSRKLTLILVTFFPHLGEIQCAKLYITDLSPTKDIPFKDLWSNLWPMGHMQSRMAVNAAQHKIVNLLKTV